MTVRGLLGKKPGLLWLFRAMGLALTLVYFTVAFASIKYASDARVDGWTASLEEGGWLVQAVDSDGPAAGKLQPGDRLQAVAGDRRIARIGPHLKLLALPVGAAYSVDVSRGGVERRETLDLPGVRDPSFRLLALIYLTIAGVCLALAFTLSLAKPTDRMAQYGAAGATFFAFFNLWLALRGYDGVLQLWPMTLAMKSSVPLYMIFLYLFIDRFPSRPPAGKRWVLLTGLIVVWGLVIWVGRSTENLLFALDPERGIDLAYRFYGFVGLHPRYVLGTEGSYVALVIAGSATALVRNYRALITNDARRRVHWVLVGLFVGLVPIALIGVLDGLSRVFGFSPGFASFMAVAKRGGNLMVALLPVAMGYAILRHQVMGIRVVVGRGLQYLLAQNVLRAGIVLPLAWTAVLIFSDPNATVGDAVGRAASVGNLVLLGLALFGLRYRVRLVRLIDRKFFREAYDSDGVLRSLSQSVREGIDFPGLLAAAGRHVESGLHVRRVLTFQREQEHMILGVSLGGNRLIPAIPIESLLQYQLDAVPVSATRDELRSSGCDHAADWMEKLSVDLAVPIKGHDEQLAGLLLLGPKSSETQYTSEDRNLIQNMATQMTTAHEVISLRERVDEDRKIHRRVRARLGDSKVDYMRECRVCGRCYDSATEQCEDDASELVVQTPVSQVLDGKFRLDRLIGRGGMGAVYQATDLRLNRIVAIKIMIDDLYGDGPGARRFLREARASAKLRHPNIVGLYDYAALAGTGAYLVLEHMSGSTLEETIDVNGPFAPAVAASVVGGLLKGMEAAHAAGVIHRDLKPANIMLVGNVTDPSVKILDFGLAKIREEAFVDPKSLTRAGVTLGTMGYMSPEQFYGETVDERTDIYSMGVIAFEVLTGRVELRGVAFFHGIHEQLTRRIGGERPTSQQQKLLQDLKRMLAIDPDARFSSAAEAYDALVPAIRACPSLTSEEIVEA